MPRTIIKNGILVSGGKAGHADLVIEGEKVAAVENSASPEPDDVVIDAKGLLVLPGLVDAHTHIQLDTGIYQTADNWEIGTRAAAAGGVTTVIDFANQIKGHSFKEALDARRAEAAPAIIDYTFHMVILEPAHDLDRLAADLDGLLEIGISSVKLFTTYRPNYYLDDAALLHIFEARPPGMVAMIHCENDAIVTDATQRLVEAGQTGWEHHAQGRPPEAEIEAVNRVISLASFPDSSAPVYIAHCSTGDSVASVHEWRGKLANVACETCPQYLLLDDSVYQGDYPEHYILQPPLRKAHNSERLREFVRHGLIDVISTDSCDYTLDQKEATPDFTRTPGGLPGLETLLPLTYTLFVDELGLPVEQIIPLMSENPARIFSLYPHKGTLQAGSDADVVLYDPQPESSIDHHHLHYLAGYSPYQGRRVRGTVRMTISRGEIIYRDGEIVGATGRGRFVPAKPAPLVSKQELR